MIGQGFDRTIVVTGGAGFIGSNFLLKMVRKYPNYLFLNVDKLTYAGNLKNLDTINSEANYKFIHCDIADEKALDDLFQSYDITHIINFAAESHVDRSITDPFVFVRSNIFGTVNLLNHALRAWQGHFSGRLFYQVSTDEVYGSLAANENPFTETNPYTPHSPYSASKASSDHFVRAYHDTYGLPILISNCSNNYGPYQFPEKLIPLCISNILKSKPLPIYGDGLQVRDWLYVEDHVDAIDLIFHQASIGSTYNIGGDNEVRNIDLVKILIEKVDRAVGRPSGTSLDLITYVKDRPGHDVRYGIDFTKLRSDLGWTPQYSADQGLSMSVDWYLSHQEWLEDILSGEYRSYYEQMYGR